MSRRARIVQLVAKDALRHDGAPKAEHLLALDSTGRVFERFSDEDPGKWSEVPMPAKRTRPRRRNTRKL